MRTSDLAPSQKVVSNTRPLNHQALIRRDSTGEARMKTLYYALAAACAVLAQASYAESNWNAHLGWAVASTSLVILGLSWTRK